MRETDDNYWDNGDDSNGDHGKCYQQQVLFIHDPFMPNQSSKPKTRRRRWTQKDMTNAFNAVKCTGMSLRGAASHYNVPESTLRDRVHGRVSLDCSRPGPPTFFTFEEEKKMVDHILFMSKIGYPYTRNQVVELAGDMTKAVDRIAPFKFLNPSQAWFYAFLNRWPDLKNYLYGPRSNRKSKGVSAESIQAYYDNLEKVLTKYDIKNKPENIWMTDEVSIACDNSNIPKILPITIQRPQSNTYWNPTAAVLGAGNAAGDKIPAFLMFKASEISNDMMEGTLKGSKFATSNSGWVNADAFIQWYERHFRPLISQRPVILLYDGHLQFVTVRVLEKAKEDNVLLFPLPPHPPYNHCVESSCFAAYPKYFNKRIQKLHDDMKRNVSKNNVSRVICQAYEWALQPINLISIFFKLGICPYNNLSNNLAPYMPDNYDDYCNYENMENAESDYSHYDSPVDRNCYNNDDGYMPLTPLSQPHLHLSHSHHHSVYPHSNILSKSSSNHSALHHNLQLNNLINTTSTTAADSPRNTNDTTAHNDNSNNHLSPLTKHNFYPSQNNSSSLFYGSSTFVNNNNNNGNVNASNASSSNNSTPVKVLDNMASKAMNQIHAQRSSGEFHTKFITVASSNQLHNHINNNSCKSSDSNNQLIPVKNTSNNCRSSVILRPNNNQSSISSGSSSIASKLLQAHSANAINHRPIKLNSSLVTTTTTSFTTAIGSASSTNLPQVGQTKITPIKVIRSTHNNLATIKSNVINLNHSSNNNSCITISTNTNSNNSNNRPLIRLHSVSNINNNSSNISDEPNCKKSKIILSKSDINPLQEMNEKLSNDINVSSHGLYSRVEQPSSIIVPSQNVSSASTAASTGNTKDAVMLQVQPDMIVVDTDNDEINQTCNVCGCVEPPGLSQIAADNEELVVDWAHCDFCFKWVHLQPCCDSRCVQPDNRFKCIVCINGSKNNSKVLLPSSNTMIVDDEEDEDEEDDDDIDMEDDDEVTMERNNRSLRSQTVLVDNTNIVDINKTASNIS